MERKYNGRGIDLEIYEDVTGYAEDVDALGIIKPTGIRINGVECLTPEDAPVRINGLVDKTQALTAVMTLYVRSLKVHAVSEQT